MLSADVEPTLRVPPEFRFTVPLVQMVMPGPAVTVPPLCTWRLPIPPALAASPPTQIPATAERLPPLLTYTEPFDPAPLPTNIIPPTVVVPPLTAKIPLPLKPTCMLPLTSSELTGAPSPLAM